MHKKILLAALGLAVITMTSRADERLLYYSGFNEGWTTTGSNYDAAPVTQVTDFSNEEFTFSFENVRIVTDGTTVQENTKNPVPDMTVGYLMSNKSEATITLSALKSITRIVYNHSATGDKRGWGMKVSVDGGASWDIVYNTLIVGNARAGVKVEVDVTAKLAELGKQVGDAGVMLQFYNMNTGSNAYMADLWIYGEYVSTEPQVSLTTALNIEGAGVITVTPPKVSIENTPWLFHTVEKDYALVQVNTYLNVREGKGTSYRIELKEQTGPEDLEKEIMAFLKKNGGKVDNLSLVLDHLKKKHPQFQLSDYGYNRVSSFLRSFERISVHGNALMLKADK